MKHINKRESPRVEIQLPCHVTSPGIWTNCAMSTENISRSGVLIAWHGRDSAHPLPSVGQLLTIDIELPEHHAFGQKCIHCQGTVLRIWQPEDQYPQVALRINYIDFRPLQENPRSLGAAQPAGSSRLVR
jgi:PilZ domain